MQCSQALNGDDSPCDWATELCIIGGTPGAIGAGCIPSGCDASIITSSCFRNPGYAVDNCGVWTVINPQ